MAIPVAGYLTVFSAIGANSTKQFTPGDLSTIGESRYMGSVILEVVGASTPNFTLNIQGRASSDGTYTNVDYVEIYKAGAAALANSQLTVNDTTRRFYLIPNIPAQLQLVAVYSAGTLTVHAYHTSQVYDQWLATGPGGVFIEGHLAHDAVDAGNPIKVGGKAQSGNPGAVANLDRVDAMFDEYGSQRVTIGENGISNRNAKVLNPDADDEAANTQGLKTMALAYGLAPDALWDRVRTFGNTAGAGLGVLLTAQAGLQAEVSVTKALAAAGDYAAEDVMSESASSGTVWTFAAVLPNNADRGYIVKAIILSETTALTPRLTLYLFNASPTSAVNDNVANTAVLHADISQYIGRIDFPAMEDLGGDSEAIATSSIVGNLPIAFATASDANDLIGILVTRDAITGEVATDDMTIKLTIEKA